MPDLSVLVANLKQKLQDAIDITDDPELKHALQCQLAKIEEMS